MKYRYPKRWSRERRKRARARDIYKAWLFGVSSALKECLDGIWGDAFKPSPWGEGHERFDAPFVDDAEFLS